MSLRDRQVQHTREWIADCALRLFEEQGFDATTLEAVAAAAEVSVSTLYRYFPTKDSLLVGHPALPVGALAGLLDSREASEPIGEALAEAALAYLDGADAGRVFLERIRTQLDQADSARSRLWDYWAREESLLVDAVRARVGIDADPVAVAVAARVTMDVVVLAVDGVRGDPTASARNLGERALDALAAGAADDGLLPRRRVRISGGTTSRG